MNIPKPKKMKNIAIVLIALTLSVSCKKDPRPVGPSGKDGINGKDGNANVKSMTVNITSVNWTSGGTEYYTDISCPIITADISNTGSVEVVMLSISNSNVWLNLPYSYIQSGYETIFNYNYEQNSVRVYKLHTDGSQAILPTNNTFKITAISGNL